MPRISVREVVVPSDAPLKVDDGLIVVHLLAAAASSG
jgi:hypothetical protein